MVRSQWEPFAAAVAELDLPVRRALLTHAHIDHCGGTKSFPHAAVYGSQQTSDVLDAAMPLDAYKAFMPAFEDEFDDLEELGTRPVTHIVDGAAYLTPRIELLPAEGHTEGDILVLVADADLCFAGDLCFFGVTPLAFQGNPAVWAEMLDAIADLAGVIVPGTAPSAARPRCASCRATSTRASTHRATCTRSLRAHGTRGSSASATRSTWSAPRCSRSGDDEIPQSMLKAMGFA